jgi:hypothetical protein
MKYNTQKRIRTTSIFFFLVLLPTTWGDFRYLDFNTTQGLTFNGAASTSSCGPGTIHAYDSGEHGINDFVDKMTIESPLIEESTDVVIETTTETFTREEAIMTSRYLGVFPHSDAAGMPPLSAEPILPKNRRKIRRDEYPYNETWGNETLSSKFPYSSESSIDAVNDACLVRLRLTPSRPFQVGSVMRRESIRASQGFEVGFSYQVADQSVSCMLVKDASFSSVSHKACSVRGGDGFAFIIHTDVNESRSIGNGGSALGYAGIKNAIAIEFDTWYNGGIGYLAELRMGRGGSEGAGFRSGTSSGSGITTGGGSVDADRVEDHISIHASFPYKDSEVTQGLDTQLGSARLVTISDSKVHYVKIIYWPYLKEDLVERFSCNSHCLRFLRNDGEGRGLGTLAVYIDDEVNGPSLEHSTPILATPINLDEVLQSAEGQATVGFTGSTGRTAWQSHDILDWYFCEQVGCPQRNQADTIFSVDPREINNTRVGD